MNIKTYSFLLLSLLMVWGNVTRGQKPVISSVTVQPSGSVKINWFPIAGASAYEIYRDSIKINEQGFNPIDTVVGSNSFEYIDIEVDARNQSVGYKIKYIPGEELSDPHYTIYLNKIIYDSCSRTNTLNWNSYKTWQDAVYYNIYDRNGNNIVLNWPDTTYTHNISSGLMYSYIIKAVNSISPSFTSSSNIDSIFTTPIKQPNTDNFYIKNITYNGSIANFNVTIDNTADLIGHCLMVSNDNSIFTETAFDTINKNNSVIEFSHDTINQPFFYKVNAIGVCKDTVASTKVVKPMVLSISESNETEVTLDWNISYIESIEDYAVSLTIDNSIPTVLPPQNSRTYYFENLDTEDKGELFCFTVTATETSGNTSLSNTICTSRIPKLNFPNAFSPNSDGKNDRFGPFGNYIKNVDLAEFKITIYDKFGGAIFVSDNPAIPWTGLSSRTSLKYVSEGGYIYYLWFKTAQGKTYEKSGTINVVYP